jgi:hypothetical protein
MTVFVIPSLLSGQALSEAKDFHPAQGEVQVFWMALGTGNPECISGVEAEGDNGQQDVDEFESVEI